MTDPQSKDEQAMRPCPKCGAPVHPENTGFHHCLPSSKTESFPERWKAALQGHSGETELWEVSCEMSEEIQRLRAAIVWALGYTDFRGRGVGEGAYWWRKELRERSGMQESWVPAATPESRDG